MTIAVVLLATWIEVICVTEAGSASATSGQTKIADNVVSAPSSVLRRKWRSPVRKRRYIALAPLGNTNVGWLFYHPDPHKSSEALQPLHQGAIDAQPRLVG